MSRVSVIVPTYNCGRFIVEAIESILAQSYPAHEIIIIDDGSTDNTRELVEGLGRPEIRYVYQSNAGVSAARNHGMELAEGEYIAFLDADDRWLPEMLQHQVEILDAHPGVVFCTSNFVRFIHETGEKQADQFSFYPELITPPKTVIAKNHLTLVTQDAFSFLISFGEFPAYTSAIIFRKSKVGHIKFNTKLKICEDAEFVLKVSTLGQVAFNSRVLMELRRHDTNATRVWSTIHRDKIAALLSIETFDKLTIKDRYFLNSRLVKAYIDSAKILIDQGHLIQSISTYRKVFDIQGFHFRKVKGFIRLTLSAITYYMLPKR